MTKMTEAEHKEHDKRVEQHPELKQDEQQHPFIDPDIDLNEGDRVEYYPLAHQTKERTSTGIIKKIVMHDNEAETVAKGRTRHVHAKPDHPRYLIENDHTHKESAIKRTHIIRIVK
ncbi:hypothetical protein MP228_004187 [Amoeboaphelidium protococcarum]|nr:hypothetical protein MP228_004187 [Amoeboaphelidium protococcarum]